MTFKNSLGNKHLASVILIVKSPSLMAALCYSVWRFIEKVLSVTLLKFNKCS